MGRYRDWITHLFSKFKVKKPTPIPDNTLSEEKLRASALSKNVLDLMRAPKGSFLPSRPPLAPKPTPQKQPLTPEDQKLDQGKKGKKGKKPKN